MHTLLRTFALVPLLLLPLFSRAADNKAKPVTPPVAAPAFVDVVKFDIRADGEDHPVVVTSAPNLLRIDEPKDRYSVIYDEANDHYTGLEHSNYTYWEFSWAEVRADVEASKRAAVRFRDLNADGMGDYSHSADTNAAPATSSSTMSDNGPGYIWKATTEKKKIAGLDCVKWTGDTPTGDSIEAWCFNGPQPRIQAALDQLRKINEPMALVPVRTIVPPLVFGVYDALVKGGVTPITITWGAEGSKNHFNFVESSQRDGKISLFTVPKLYMKTTLITMDGMLNQPAKKGK